MEVYFQHIPYFVLFVGLGIIVNIVRKLNKKEKLTKLRILEEVIASFWIALVGAGLLDYYTEMSPFLIYGLSSAFGFFHSLIIDKVGKGIVEIILSKVKKVTDKGSSDNSTVIEENNDI